MSLRGISSHTETFMTDLSKEPIEKLHQIAHLLMPNTAMHIAVNREIERRKKSKILMNIIISSVMLILCVLTLIAVMG